LATSTGGAGGPEPRFCTLVFDHEVRRPIVAAAESNAMRADVQFAASHQLKIVNLFHPLVFKANFLEIPN